MRTTAFALVVCAAGVLAAGVVHAQIDVSGVDDEDVHADRVTFTIRTEAGWDYSATLNAEPVAVGVPVTVDVPEYYELFVTRASQTSGDEESLLIRFIIRASDRKNSEWGLPRWTPYPLIPSAAAEFTGASLEVIIPAAFPAGMEIPVITLVGNETGRVGVNGVVNIEGTPGGSVDLLRGVGSALLPAAGETGTFAVHAGISQLEADRSISIEDDTAWVEISGEVSTSTDWGEDARIHVTSSLSVPAGVTLTVGAGSIVMVAPDKEIEVDGSLVVNGTRERPAVFLPERRAAPWGGFLFRSATSRVEMTETILTGSGADPNWFSNHSGSGHSHLHEQALFYLSGGARATLTDCYIIDNAGQAGHGEDSYLTMTRCLVQRCVVTGQYNGGSVRLFHTALVEFPDKDAPFADDDSDAFYLTGGAHELHDCLIGWCLDDALDAGSGDAGSVTLERCWLEAAYHEAFGWSRSRTAVSTDTVTINCGQGIECGNGGPDVVADRSLSTANAVGARFGDNYTSSFSGSLEVRNSLLLYNKRDVWGREWDTWEEHASVSDPAGGFEMYIHDNYLTAANPLHPDNTVWDPVRDAALLEPFLPTPATTVGIGIALREPRIDAAGMEEGVPVRLSTFTTRPVSADYEVMAGGAVLASGTLDFPAGETVRHIPLDGITVDEETGLRVVLLAASGADITGLSEAFILPDPNVVLVAAGSTWKYHAAGEDLGSAWRASAYDDTSWPDGPAEIGYGDGDEATEIDGGPSGDRRPTAYFRKTFDVADPAALEGLEIRLRRDDGAVVYLNGQEVFRSNMPAGEISYSDWAAGTASDDGDDVFTHEIAASLLTAGANVVAVEVHQTSATSSDMSFDLELAGFRAVPVPGSFVRGDANGDAAMDISDAVTTLLYLFSGAEIDCEDAMDADDDGAVNITDAVYALEYLFRGGRAIPPPYPSKGSDPTADGLTCTR